MICHSSGADARAVAEALRNLPPPDPAAAEVSARLVQRIRDAVVAAGPPGLPFARFMQMALYEPGLGYYSAGSRKFGPDGDFVTAPELSPLFSRCVARQCREVLAVTGGGILEFGAGAGTMAADILAELERLDCLPTAYFILEVSADLRQRQAETLAAKVPALAARVQWLDGWPDSGFTGVVLANEVLDAMPAHRFRVEQGVPCERMVGVTDDGFVETSAGFRDRRVAEMATAVVREYALPDGYLSEVCPAAVDWTRELAGRLERGAAIVIDYGFPGREFYHPQRFEGTLMCHYRHRSHQDPYAFIGLQDITAHVDFTAVAEAAAAAGLKVAGFANQANFLLGNGLSDMLAADDPQAQFALAASVRRLIFPEEMGELFKVLALTRGLDGPLSGFALRDDRVRL